MYGCNFNNEGGKTMLIENMKVFNLEGAMRGMRMPMESWDKSDSHFIDVDEFEVFIIGDNDIKLGQNLVKSGQDHRKFMRQVLVSMDITASMSFWWDIDTYKVGTEKNSTSRMHKLTSKECRHLIPKDFNWKEMTPFRYKMLTHYNELIDTLKNMRNDGVPIMAAEYQEVFEELINDLPQGYLFTRHWTGNYEVLYKLYHARKNHKQKEIRDFCDCIKDLPYFREFVLGKV